MNKILIHKGDCTVFANNSKFLTFYIQTDLDMTGWYAEFKLFSIIRRITDLTNKSFEVKLSHKETSQLLCGDAYGSVVLVDNRGNVKTIVNDIPFEITSKVVENEYQEIDLTIPETSGVDIKLKVGAETVTSVNGMTGDVVLEIPNIDGLATKKELETKQDKGNYALVEDIPTQVSELDNDSNFATQTQVMQAIASIPQFSLSIVNKLPTTGEKMTLYLVPKEGSNNDVYDEYIWIEQTSTFEHLGTTAVDLTDYVKNTDYAQGAVGGVVKVSGTFACGATNGYIQTTYIPTLERYNNLSQYAFIGKGTLETALTQYSKTVSLTQTEYDALETKDANTLYLIEE